MYDAPVICGNCGAPVDDDRQFCQQCGARAVQGVADLEQYRTAPERFDRVEVAPGYRATLEYVPPLPALRELRRPVTRVVFACAVFVAVLPQALSKHDLQTLAVAVSVGLAWIGYEIYQLVRVIRRLSTRTERTIAIVAKDVLDRDDPAGVCDRRVELRARDGTHRRVFAPGVVMGQVSAGDIGVAYVRGDRLIDFRWFDVMAPPLDAGEMPRAASCDACGGPQRFGPITDRCAYCGAPLPKPDLGEFGARFLAASASPAAAEATRKRVPLGVPSVWEPLFVTAVGVFFVYVAYRARPLLEAAVARWRFGFVIPLLALAPLAIGLVGIWRRTAPYRAGLRHELAVIVRTRDELVAQNSEKETWRHYATIAGPNGARRELDVLPALSRKLVRGQLGVAHLRGSWLASFTPL